jgi:hypothetical protein
LNLELHKRMMRQLQEELSSSADLWEKDLEEKVGVGVGEGGRTRTGGG